MSIRIAIHSRAGSFSDQWIARCKEKGIPHEIVNCYDSQIIDRLVRVDALMWHFSHVIPTDVLVSGHIVKASEALGITVFPNSATCWHFDNKVAQKYLLESVGAPLVPTYVFYSPEMAQAWVEKTEFPKVFKLARGAGSANVRLIRTREEAGRVIKKAFAGGFRPIPSYFSDVRTRYRQSRRRGDMIWDVLRRVPRVIARVSQSRRMFGREMGYVYFQDFIPGNAFDTRVTVIGERAFAFTRNVRRGDFRASGGGDLCYDLGRIRLDCVKTAFEITRRISAQSLAFDFVMAPDGRYLVTEICFAYNSQAIFNCKGHWDPTMSWHECQVWPQDAILDDVVTAAAAKQCTLR